MAGHSTKSRVRVGKTISMKPFSTDINWKNLLNIEQTFQQIGLQC